MLAKRLDKPKSVQSLKKRLLLKKLNTIFLSILSKGAPKGGLFRLTQIR